MVCNNDDKFLDDLFLRNKLSCNWAISNTNITYEFCWVIFEKYDKIYRVKLNLTEYVVMENVFKWIDSSILFPNNENFKTLNVKLQQSVKKSSGPSGRILCLKNGIGPHSAELGLSTSVFDKILSENYDYSTDILKGQYISNHVALEIFSFNNKDVKFSDKCEVLSFLSGKERRSNDLQNKTLYSRLTHLKKSNEKNWTRGKKGFKSFIGGTI